MARYIYVRATNPDTWETSGVPAAGGNTVGPYSGVVRLRETPENRKAVNHHVDVTGKLKELDDPDKAEELIENYEEQCKATTAKGSRCSKTAATDESGEVINGYCSLPAHQKLAS